MKEMIKDIHNNEFYIPLVQLVQMSYVVVEMTINSIGYSQCLEQIGRGKEETS